jgi:hypothetical protein
MRRSHSTLDRLLAANRNKALAREKAQTLVLCFVGFHQFAEGYGGFEVFASQHSHQPAGWYWWACLPGCLPDGDATGPFKSAAEAYHDAVGDEQ